MKIDGILFEKIHDSLWENYKENPFNILYTQKGNQSFFVLRKNNTELVTIHFKDEKIIPKHFYINLDPFKEDYNKLFMEDLFAVIYTSFKMSYIEPPEYIEKTLKKLLIHNHL